jgi:RNA polymerase sigma-70 factor (ECF subfamily)
MSGDSEGRTGFTLYALLEDLTNQEAWARFVDRYAPRIYGWCRARRLQDADAQNVTQEVLRKLFVSLSTFDPKKGRFRSWLRSVTLNACRDSLRGRAARERGSGDSKVQGMLEGLEDEGGAEELARTMDEEIERQFLEEAMERARLRVGANTWEAFRLVALEGHKPKDVAARLGVNLTTVYMAKDRVKKMLREEMDLAGLEGEK